MIQKIADIRTGFRKTWRSRPGFLRILLLTVLIFTLLGSAVPAMAAELPEEQSGAGSKTQGQSLTGKLPDLKSGSGDKKTLGNPTGVQPTTKKTEPSGTPDKPGSGDGLTLVSTVGQKGKVPSQSNFISSETADPPEAGSSGGAVKTKGTSSAANNVDQTQLESTTTLGSAGAPAGMPQTPSLPEPGKKDEKPEYGQAPGSVCIKELGEDLTYKNTLEGNAIQNALEDALTYAKSLYVDPAVADCAKSVTIIVEDGVYEGGISIGKAAEEMSPQEASIHNLIREIADLSEEKQDPISLSIVARDTLDQAGAPTLESKGRAQLEGDVFVNFRDLNLMLAGIYYSTKNKILVEEAASVTVTGTALDDEFSVAAKAPQSEIRVDTLGGDDRVEVTIEKQPTFSDEITFGEVQEDQIQQTLDALNSIRSQAQINASQLPQEIKDQLNTLYNSLVEFTAENGELSPALQVHLDLGQGNDSLDVDLIDSTYIAQRLNLVKKPAGGENILDRYGLSYQILVDLGKIQVTANGGDGHDRMLVRGREAPPEKQVTPELIYEAISGLIANSEKADPSLIVLNGGRGDDVITVDTSTAFTSTGRPVKVETGGEDGCDRLHLSGDLHEQEQNLLVTEQPGGKTRVDLVTEKKVVASLYKQKRNLQITALDTELYTDTLNNKPTITLERPAGTEQGKPVVLTLNPLSYVNYYVPESFFELHFTEYPSVDLTVKLPSTQVQPWFTNILVQSKKEDYHMEIRRLDAQGLNVVIEGGGIHISGPVKGRNVLVRSLGQEDPLTEIPQVNMESDPISAWDNLKTFQFSMDFANLSKNREILISRGGSIIAQGCIDLLAQIEFNHELQEGMRNSLAPLVVKVGSANIDILGTLGADGPISVATDLCLNLDGTNKGFSLLVPIAISVAQGSSTIHVGEDARITSGQSLFIGPRTELHMEDFTRGGFPKFAIAISIGAGVLKNTLTVDGSSVIQSLSDIMLKAKTVALSQVISWGKPPTEINTKFKTGANLAVNVVFADNFVKVLEHARLSAGRNLDILADSNIHANTSAIMIPMVDETKWGVVDMIDFPMKILTGHQFDFGAVFKGLIGKKLSIKDPKAIFNTVIGPSIPNGTETQLAGALALAILSNDNQALLHTDGAVEAGNILRLLARGQIFSTGLADASLYKTPSMITDKLSMVPIPAKAIGAAVGLGVIRNHNLSELHSNVTADHLKVQADLGQTGSSMIVLSGHAPASEHVNLAVTGAVSVQVVQAVSNAILRGGHTHNIRENGTVTVTSDGRGWFSTVGDASGTRERKNIKLGFYHAYLQPPFVYKAGATGIGTGIAVGVIGVDVNAQMEDGVNFAQPLSSLQVSSDYRGVEENMALAGAKGGKAVAPVVNVAVSGISARSSVGKGTALDPLKNMLVKAVNQVSRRAYADAKVVGSGVGIGGTIGITVLNDSAESILGRSVSSKKLALKALSVSHLHSKVRAGSEGAKPSTGSGPSTPNGWLNQKDKEKTGSENTKQDDVEGHSSEDPLDDDGESLRKLFELGETDAMANANLGAVQDLTKGVNTRNVNPTAVGGLTANRPLAQTQEGSVQAAAAAGFNIQHNSSLAKICDGVVIKTDSPLNVHSNTDTDSTLLVDASATKSTVGVGVAAAVNAVTYENQALVGASSLCAPELNIVACTLEDAENRMMEEILADLLSFLADTQGNDILEKALLDATEDESMETLLSRKFPTYQALAPEDRQALKEELIRALVSNFRKDQTDDAGLGMTAVESITANTIKAVSEELMKFFSFDNFAEYVMQAFLNQDPNRDPLEDMLKKHGLTGKILATRLYQMAKIYMQTKFGNPSELDGLGNKFSTSAISGAGAANVGIAGAAAISVITGNTKALLGSIEGDTLRRTVEVPGAVKILAVGTQQLYTTGTASTEWGGAPCKNKTGDALREEGDVGVGASVATAILDAKAEALVDGSCDILGGTLALISQVHNDVDTNSVAGSDPLARRDAVFNEPPVFTHGIDPLTVNNVTYKDVAVDASVALNILESLSHSLIAENARLTLRGTGTLEIPDPFEHVKGQKEEQKKTAQLLLQASQRGQTLSNASGFAVGNASAVGAALAVNLATSDVQAISKGTAVLSGNAAAHARTFNEDQATGLATVVGVNLDRYLEKLRSVEGVLSVGEKRPDGLMPLKVMNIVNKISGKGPCNRPVHDPVEHYTIRSMGKIQKSVPLMATLFQWLNIKLPGSTPLTQNSGEVTEALSHLTDNTKNPNSYLTGEAGNGIGGPAVQDTNSQHRSMNVAAAVGVNVTNHEAKSGICHMTASALDVQAENRANYRTLGTGASVDTEAGTNNIAVGVAVTVNANRADARMGGSITATGGNVTLGSRLTQNMDGQYRGLLGAQSISGSVGGANSKIGAAGSVAVLHAMAKARAVLEDNTTLTALDRDVTILSEDLSKLAIRADSFQVSGGTPAVTAEGQPVDPSCKMGFGASFGMIYADNEVTAQIGQGSKVQARNLTVKAEKLPVTAEHYQFPMEMADLITVDVPDENPTEKGLINIKLEESRNGIAGIDVALGTDDLLKILDMVNYLSSVNYYTEAMAGSINAQEGKNLALAGAMAMVYARSLTQALVSQEKTDLDTTLELSGDLKVSALSKTNARMLGGTTAIASGKEGTATGKYGGGLNIAASADRDQVLAKLGDRVQVTKAASAEIRANAHRNHLCATLAAEVATGQGSVGMGGNVNTTVTGSTVYAGMGSNGSLQAEAGDVKVLADNTSDMILVTANVAGGTKIGAGGTVGVLVSNNETTAEVGDYTAVTGRNICIKAMSRDRLIDVLTAVTGSRQVGVAAAATVNVSTSRTTAKVGMGNEDNLKAPNLWAPGGTIEIAADSLVEKIIVAMGASGSFGGTKATSVGAAANVNVFEHSAQALVDSGAVITNLMEKRPMDVSSADIIIRSGAEDFVVIVTAAGSAATDTGIAGAIPVAVSNTVVRTEIGSGATLSAYDSVLLSSTLNNGFYHAGGVVGGGTRVGAGATINTQVLNATVETIVRQNARILAQYAEGSNGAVWTRPGSGAPENRREQRKGIHMLARSCNQMVMVSFSGVGAGTVAMSGVVNTMVMTGTTQAIAEQGAQLTSGFEAHPAPEDPQSSEDSGEEPDPEPGITLDARDESEFYNVAGSLNGANNVAIGTTTVVQVYRKTVKAELGAKAYSLGKVLVNTDSEDRTILVSCSAGGAANTSVQESNTVLVNKNAVSSLAGGGPEGRLASKLGGIYVTALSGSDLYAQTGELGGAATAAVMPAITVVVYEGLTEARIRENTQVCCSRDLFVTAESSEFINGTAAGAGGAATAAVSGAVVVTVGSQKTIARIEDGAVIPDCGSITVEAMDSFTSRQIICCAAGSALAGVSAGVAVNVLNASVIARIGNAVSIGGGTGGFRGSLKVTADALRDMSAYTGSIGAGQAGVGANILVTVTGGKLPQEASDAVNKVFDPEGALQNTLDQADYGDAHPCLDQEIRQNIIEKDLIVDALTGDGKSQTHTVGHTSEDENGNLNPEFDMGEGYESPELNANEDPEGHHRGETFVPEIPETSKDLGPIEDLDVAPAYVGKEDPKNIVSATVGKVIIRAAQNSEAGNVTVYANENVICDMISGTLSIGFEGSGGMGTAITVLYSNVEADLADGSQVQVPGTILVRADTGSDPVTDDTGLSTELAKQLKGSKVDFTKRSIRSISVSASGAAVAVTVPISCVNVFTRCHAGLGGSDLQAGAVKVLNLTDYSGMVSATLALGVGAATPTGSASTVAFLGQSDAVIRDGTKITLPEIGTEDPSPVRDIVVNTVMNSGAVSAAAPMGYSPITLNGGFALVYNRNKGLSAVGRNVTIQAPGHNVSLLGNSDTLAKAYILSGAISGSVRGLNAAITIVDPTMETVAGQTLSKAAGKSSAEAPRKGTGITAENLTIHNRMNAEAVTSLLQLQNGMESTAINVLVCFNRSRGRAMLTGTNADIRGDISIDAQMKARSASLMTTAANAMFTKGIFMTYVRMQFDNAAVIDSTGAVVSAGNIYVNAGREEDENGMEAVARSISICAGGMIAQVNTAIAHNDGLNMARLQGSGRVEAEKLLRVHAFSQSKAVAKVLGLGINTMPSTGSTLAGDLVVSVLENTQKAHIASGTVRAKTLSVRSGYNRAGKTPASQPGTDSGSDSSGDPDPEKDTDPDEDGEPGSYARILTGYGPTTVSVRLSAAVSYMRSQAAAAAMPNLVELLPGSSAEILSEGQAVSRSRISNLLSDSGKYSTGLYGAFAYNQAKFDAELGNALMQESAVSGEALTVKTDYTSTADAHLNPCVLPFKANKFAVQANIAVAINSSKAKAEIGPGVLRFKAAEVLAKGMTNAKALVHTPYIGVNEIEILADVVYASLEAQQDASVRKASIYGEDLTVRSIMNQGDTPGASAQLGSARAGAKLSGISGTVSTATAYSAANSIAKIHEGACLHIGNLLTLSSSGKADAQATIPGTTADLVLGKLGVAVMAADTAGEFSAVTENSEIHAGKANITTDYTATAFAETAQPDFGMGGLTVNVNSAAARTDTRSFAGSSPESTSGILSCDLSESGNDLLVEAKGRLKAEAKIKPIAVNVYPLIVAANVVSATMGGTQQASLRNLQVKANHVTVRSSLNDRQLDPASGTPKELKPGANAVLEAAYGAEISTVTTKGNRADAAVTAASKALIEGSTLELTGRLDLSGTGSAWSQAGLGQQNGEANLLGLGVNIVNAETSAEFSALLRNSQITAAAADILTDYVSKANASTAQPINGLAGLELRVNLANAVTNSTALAGSEGNTSGWLRTGEGDVTVKAKGLVQADARVIRTNTHITAGDVGANEIHAKAGGLQQAQLQNMEIQAGNLTVESSLNEDQTQDGTTTEILGANAELSANGGGGADVSLAASEGNSAEAIFTATGNAAIKNAQATLSKNLTLQSQGTARSYAGLGAKDQEMVTVGLGVNLVESLAKGCFHAKLEDSTVTAGSAVLSTRYTSQAQAISAQPSFGMGTLQLKVNLSHAENGTDAYAGVRGGSLTCSSGDVSIENLGQVTAKAVTAGTNVEIQGAKVAVNQAEAKAAGVQKAIIEGGAVIKAGTLSVISSFNKALGLTTPAAYAQVGSNSGAAISVYAVDSNKANAILTAEAAAEIRDAQIETQGEVLVENQAWTFADATVQRPGSGSLLNVTVMKTRADTAGTFRALFHVDRESSIGGSLWVHNRIHLLSQAKTGAYGALVGGVGTDVNKADAKASLQSLAELDCGAALNVQGDTDILANTLGSVKAEILNVKLQLSAGTVAANEVNSFFGIRQDAKLLGRRDRAGLTVGRGLKVQSYINSSDLENGSFATVSGPDTTVSALSYSENKAKAELRSANLITVSNLTLQQAQTVQLRAVTENKVKALASDGAVYGILGLGNLKAETAGQDTADVVVEHSTMTTAGEFLVETRADNQYLSTGNSVGRGLVNVSPSTHTSAQIGDRYDRQRSTIDITDAYLFTGSFTARATNLGQVQAKLQKQSAGALASVSSSSLPTQSYYETNLSLTATRLQSSGAVTMELQEYTKGTSDATDKNISFGVYQSTTKGCNKMDAKAILGFNNAHIQAQKDILAQIHSHADYIARTYCEGTGFLGGNALMEATNDLRRKAAIRLVGSSTMESSQGDITLRSSVGQMDNIETKAGVASGGLIALGSGTAHTNVETDSQILLQPGVTMTARMGDILLNADASEYILRAGADVAESGLYTGPTALADGALKLSAEIKLLGDPSSRVLLLGKNVKLLAEHDSLNAVYTPNAEGIHGAGGNVDSIVTMDLQLEKLVELQFCDIQAYEDLRVITQAGSYPSSSSGTDYAVQLSPFGLLHGAGTCDAVVNLTGQMASKLSLNGGVEIWGTDVLLDGGLSHYDPDGRKTVTGKKAAGIQVRPWTKVESGVRSGEDVRNVNFLAGDSNQYTFVKDDTVFHIGPSAMGVRIEIREDGITHSGLTDAPEVLIQEASDQILIKPIINHKGGRLEIAGHHTGDYYTIYYQSTIPSFTVINYTDKDVQIEGFQPKKLSQSVPGLFGIAPNAKIIGMDSRPQVTIQQEKTGDTYITGILMTPDGTVNLLWTGEQGGRLASKNAVLSDGSPVAPVWAHSLVIRGADSAGPMDPSEDAFGAILFWLYDESLKDWIPSGEDIQIRGDSVIRLSPGELQLGLPQEPKNAPVDGLKLTGVKTGGDNHLILGPGHRIWSLSQHPEDLKLQKALTQPHTLGGIQGDQVTLTLEGTGTVLEGSGTGKPDVKGSSVTLVSGTGNSLGTQEAPLDVEGPVGFQTPEGTRELQSHAYLTRSTGDLILAPDLTVRNAVLQAQAQKGSIHLTDVTVTGEAERYPKLILTAAKDILQDPVETQGTRQGLYLGGGAEAQLKAEGDVRLHQILGLDGRWERATVTAGGDFHAEKLSSRGFASKITVNAGGDLHAGQVTAADTAEVRLKAETGSITAKDVLAETEAVLQLQANSGITMEDLTLRDQKTRVTVETKSGDLTMKNGELSREAMLYMDLPGKLTAENVTLKDKSLLVAMAAQQVTGKKLSLSGGARGILGSHQAGVSLEDLSLTQESGLQVSGKTQVSTGNISLSGESQAFVSSAEADLTLGNADITGGSALSGQCRGNLTAGDIQADGGLGAVFVTQAGDMVLGNVDLRHESMLDANANGKMTLESLQLGESSRAELNSRANGITSGPVTLDQKAELTATAIGPVEIESLTAGGGSTAELTSKEDRMALGNTHLYGGSQLTAEACKDLTFSMMELAGKSTLHLISRLGNLLSSQKDGYIRCQDGESKLSLSAGGNMGTSENHLILDVPETLVPAIQKAVDLFLDGVVLTGGLFEGKRPAEKPVHTGRAENGETITGTWLGKDREELQTIHIPGTEFKRNEPGQMMTWLKDHLTATQWRQLLGQENLHNQLTAGSIPESTLREVLKGTLSQQELDRMIREKDYAALGSHLQTQVRQGAVSDAIAEQWLKNSMWDLTEAELKPLVEAGMTKAEYDALLEQLLQNADYSGTLPVLQPQRALKLLITETTGESTISNVGDLRIIQTAGSFTAKDIRSRQGQVSITAKDSILAGDNGGKPNIQGGTIHLTAEQGTIGSEDRTLLTEQVKTEPQLVITRKQDDLGSKPDDLDLSLMYSHMDGLLRKTWTAGYDLRYDWILTQDPEAAGILNAAAGKDIFLSENTGDLGLGTVTAGGNASLTAPGSILDTREPCQQDQSNLTAGGDADLQAGGTIGTTDAPIHTDVEGELRAESKGDMAFEDPDQLKLTASSEKGQISAHAKNGIDLTSPDPQADLTVGPIHSDSGTVRITSQNSILEGTCPQGQSLIKGDSIELIAKNGTIGTREDPLEVDTNAENGGTLSGSAQGPNAHVNLRETQGGASIGSLHSDGDLNLEANGPITDADGSQPVHDAVEAQRKAQEARTAADAADKLAQMLETYGKPQGKLEKELQKAQNQKALEAVEKTLQSQLQQQSDLQAQLTDPSLSQEEKESIQTRLDTLEQKIRKTDEQKKALQAQRDRIRKALQDNLDHLAQARTDAARAQQLAADLEEAAKQALLNAQSAKDPVTANGDLTLRGQGIGTDDNALGVNAGGILDLQLTDPENQSIHGESTGPIRAKPMRGKEVSLDSLENIRFLNREGQPAVSGGEISLGSLHGDLGTPGDPLKLDGSSISVLAPNVALELLKPDTGIRSVVGDRVTIRTPGSLSSDPDPRNPESPNVIGSHTDLSAGGNIGSGKSPLKVDSDNLTAKAQDLYLDLLAPVTELQDLEGKKVSIQSRGEVQGGVVRCDSLILEALGDVGQPDRYFEVEIPGDIFRVTSKYGYVYMRNLYVPPYHQRTLRDLETGIYVIGNRIHKSAFLTVDVLTVAEKGLCETLARAISSPARIAAYRILLETHYPVKPWQGKVTVSIPVDNYGEGTELLILGCDQKGRHMLFGARVRNGRIFFETEFLGCFVILNPMYYGEIAEILGTDSHHVSAADLEITDMAMEILKAAKI